MAIISRTRTPIQAEPGAGPPLASRRIAGPALFAAVGAGIFLVGCTTLPSAGPTRDAVQHATAPAGSSPIRIVDVDEGVVRDLLSKRSERRFSETLGSTPQRSQLLGPGDVVEVSIWEAPPAALFATGIPDARGLSTGTHPTTIPEEMIDADGMISVPFAGRIPVAGKSIAAVQEEISHRLAAKANQPEVLVRLIRNASRNVSVVGEVNQSVRMPLTPHTERLLDAIAAAGGVRQSVTKVTIQVTRGSDVQALPLDAIIRDPRQNIPLQAGDVVTALYDPFSFTALGASGKNQEINFEAQGISLAQALGRAGGLLDNQSDARGVFIFRLEKSGPAAWPADASSAATGLSPVIYRFNLREPSGFFLMQSFAVDNHDVLYVSTAPVTDMQKFLNLVFSVVYPLLNAKATLGF